MLKSLWARVQLNPSGERFGGCRLFSEVGPWNKYGSPYQKGFTSIRANIEMNMYSILLNSTIYFLGLKTIENPCQKDSVCWFHMVFNSKCSLFYPLWVWFHLISSTIVPFVKEYHVNHNLKQKIPDRNKKNPKK